MGEATAANGAWVAAKGRPCAHTRELPSAQVPNAVATNVRGGREVMTPFTVSAVVDGAVLTLTLTESGLTVCGDLDASNRAELAGALDELSNRAGDVDVDLSDVDFADVATAALFVSTARSLGRGRALRLRRAPAHLVAMIRRLSGRAAQELGGRASAVTFV